MKRQYFYTLAITCALGSVATKIFCAQEPKKMFQKKLFRTQKEDVIQSHLVQKVMTLLLPETATENLKFGMVKH